MVMVGPQKWSAAGYRYVLIIHYPKAAPLYSITAKVVTAEVVNVFLWVGVPQEIITNQGTNFVCQTRKQLYKLLKIKSVMTSI